MKNWLNRQRIGFAVRNPMEFQRTVSLGADLAEIKLDRFAKADHPLYVYKDKAFRPNPTVLDALAHVARNLDVNVQFHLPIEDGISLERETGINIGVREHHEIALGRFQFLNELYIRYYHFRHCRLGSVITVHPPPFSIDGEEIIEEKEALTNSRIFFEKLDLIRRRWDYKAMVGVENQPDPKKPAACLGYLPIHFREMLKNTRTIGLTVDTGHRRLTQGFTVSGFLQLGLSFVNFHFHGNEGKFTADSYDDDQHQLPNPGNVKGYYNYLRYFRRHRPPIVLEISHLERYTDEELVRFLEKFRQEIA